jgi:aminoglycoside/choline kinase family phosphotransferase
MSTLKATPDTPLPDAIGAYLDRTGLAAAGARVLPLTGDASDRRYFRVIRPDGPSIVLALNAAPFTYDELPFVNVATLLAQLPVPIPAILGHADDLGILVQQDLGDVTLQAHVGAAAQAEHAALYRQAIEFIEAFQRRGQQLASDRYLPYRVAFDVEKLTWEFDFFVKHFCVGYRGATIDPAARAAISEECGAIVRELAGEPRVLCHRDYHSRNLMLRGDQPVHHRLSGRAHGAGHLRPGVAAPRFVRRHQRGCRRPVHRVFPGASKGAQRLRPTRWSSVAGST